VITVWQLRQEKRIELDTLFVRPAAHHGKPAQRAVPKGRRLSGHRMRVWGAHAGYLGSARVCTSAQYKVPAKMPKATAMMRTTIASVGIA
jgi:hypothetical protein